MRRFIQHLLGKPDAPVRAVPSAASSMDEPLARARASKARYCIDGLSAAVSILREALEDHPFHAEGQALLAEAYGFLGVLREMEELEADSCFEQAYTHAEAALTVDPQLAAAHRAMSVALRRGPRANAIRRRDEAHAAAALGPEEAENWIELWRALGRPNSGVAFEKAVTLGIDNAGFWIDYGVVRYKAHQFDEAESHFRRALQLSPGNALATVNLAAALQGRRRFSEAKHVVAEARRADACSALLKKAERTLDGGHGQTERLGQISADESKNPAAALARGF